MAADEARPKIEDADNSIRPTGKTPISHSLKEGLKDFGNRTGDILLISDGIETCDMDPCALMAQWRDQGVKIRVHVIGVGLNEMERKAMMCVAETGGGEYFDAGSEGEFEEALNTISEIEPGEPEPVEMAQGYGINIHGVDETGRSFIITGKLFDQEGNEVITEFTSNGQHWLDKPGDYKMEVGVLLQDGTIYKPIIQDVSITDRGIKRVEILITRPAIVSASFSENGEDHKGAHDYAYQDGEKIFGFRSFDEALARPGVYEFRSNPNDDNELTAEAELTEGEHTVVNFELVNTVLMQVRYILPNGETDQRTGELNLDDEAKYTLHGNRMNRVIPGTYELRDKYKDPLLAMAPREITVSSEEEQTIEVKLEAGYIVPEYTGSDFDLFHDRSAYTYVHALDEDGQSIGSETANPGKPEMVSPGTYRVIGHSGKGYFDPVEVTIENDSTVTATLTAKQVAEVSMRYAEGDYEREPDRATLVPMDEQKPAKTYMGIGKILKVPPGRYYIMPHSYTPEAKDTPEFTLKPGETREIIIPRK